MNIRSVIKQAVMVAGASIYRNRGSKILYYHDIFEATNYESLDSGVCMGTPLDLFKKHIQVIRNEGYEIVDTITRPEGQVAIMLDDGFRGIYECRAFFVENNIHPTVFLPVDYIGKTDRGIMSPTEILELQTLGFNFQCHGWSHVDLTTFDDVELERELYKSKLYLEQMLSKKIDSLCMPLGRFSDLLLEKIHQAGYTEIYSCLPGNYDDKPMGLLCRNLCQFASPAELKYILRGAGKLFFRRYLKLHFADKCPSFCN